MSNESVLKLIRKKGENIASKSTIHGISNLIQSQQRSFKALWLLFILLCSSSCFYLIGKNVVTYLEFNVATKLQSVQTNELDFPGIGIWYVNST